MESQRQPSRLNFIGRFSGFLYRHTSERKPSPLAPGHPLGAPDSISFWDLGAGLPQLGLKPKPPRWFAPGGETRQRQSKQ